MRARAVSTPLLSISDVTPATAAEWDAVYRACDHATYFHSPRWAQYWGRLRKKPEIPVARVVRFSDGKRAVVPLTRKARASGLLDLLASATDGMFGGWISCDDLGEEHAMLLTDYLLDGLECSLSWRVSPYDPHAPQILNRIRERAAALFAPQSKSQKLARCVANWRRPILIDDTTHALDLGAGFDSVFGSKSSSARRAKIAQKAGVQIEVTERLEDWREYFDVYQSSIARWGRDPNDTFPWELFELLFETPARERKLWVARYDGKIVCGALCFYAKCHVSYWHGSALKPYFKLKPVNFLMQEIIRHACEQGYRWYDFGPSGFLSGVIAFKESFGATSLPAPMVHVDDHIRRATRAVLFGVRGW